MGSFPPDGPLAAWRNRSFRSRIAVQFLWIERSLPGRRDEMNACDDVVVRVSGRRRDLPDAVRVCFPDPPSRRTLLDHPAKIAGGDADDEPRVRLFTLLAHADTTVRLRAGRRPILHATGSRSAPYMDPTRAGAAVAAVGTRLQVFEK